MYSVTDGQTDDTFMLIADRTFILKSVRFRRFKPDQDEIRQDCSSGKYVSID